MDGRTDGRTKDQKYDISVFYEVGTNVVFSFWWHKSRFYEGGTNVVI
jgi:hypothetical protein